MTLPALMVVLVVMLSVFISGAAVALQRCCTDHLDFHIIVGQQFDGAVFICYINIRKAEILSARKMFLSVLTVSTVSASAVRTEVR